ncbi:DUF6907 domain-containing protein [Streptomyces enissocaesilis]|uniref:Uncharacterized protein n=1 Tax=Streptomyces enissocaesilis TaxID=332589 RepID=A0ABP6K7Z8_9ACTN
MSISEATDNRQSNLGQLTPATPAVLTTALTDGQPLLARAAELGIGVTTVDIDVCDSAALVQRKDGGLLYLVPRGQGDAYTEAFLRKALAYAIEHPMETDGLLRATPAEIFEPHSRFPLCGSDHKDDLASGEFKADVTCYRYYDGVELPVFFADDKSTGGDVLRSVIDVHPYSEVAERQLPCVNLEVIEDHWIQDLDPDGLADVIAKLRGQLDQLDQVHAQLVQARADWAASQ